MSAARKIAGLRWICLTAYASIGITPMSALAAPDLRFPDCVYENVSGEFSASLQAQIDNPTRQRNAKLANMPEGVAVWYCFHGGSYIGNYDDELGIEIPRNLTSQFFGWMGKARDLYWDAGAGAFSAEGDAMEAEAIRLLVGGAPTQCKAFPSYLVSTSISCRVEYEFRYNSNNRE